MKKVLSVLLALSMILSCISMITFVVNAEETPEYVGRKIFFMTDGPNFIARSESAEISGLKDGEHSISYLVYNNGGADISVNMTLQNGTEDYKENDGTTVIIPAFAEKNVTYNFVIEKGLIKGSLCSSKQEEAALVFNIKLASENGLNMIPAGTEIIFAYNKIDGTDCLRNLDDKISSTTVSEIMTLPNFDNVDNSVDNVPKTPTPTPETPIPETPTPETSADNTNGNLGGMAIAMGLGIAIIGIATAAALIITKKKK